MNHFWSKNFLKGKKGKINKKKYVSKFQNPYKVKLEKIPLTLTRKLKITKKKKNFEFLFKFACDYVVRLL